MNSQPFFKQKDQKDCGPISLKMIAKHYGKSFSSEYLIKKCYTGRQGSSLLNLSDAAESIGFRSLGVNISINQLTEEAPFPCIVHWNQNHFVVVYGIKKGKIIVADPAHGIIKYTEQKFCKHWKGDSDKGIALLLEPTESFYTQKEEQKSKKGLSFLFNYLRPHRGQFVQLALAMLLGSLLQLILPFLTQSVVDIGIQQQDIQFIYLILGAQLVLYFSMTIVNFIKSWILLYIGERINISLISDFLIKLMRLPISYFDSKVIGDLMQRIQDHSRIESFLTDSLLNIIFSVFNLIVFSFVMVYYNWKLFVVFIIGSVLYVAWVKLFMKKRAELDFKNFQQSSENQDVLYELITGMQEIKLHNSEKQKRWMWERVQAKLYKLSMKSLRLNQIQSSGATFINELKNISITLLAAQAVIQGQMTLGMMLSVSYILGQLNGPVNQIVGFMQMMQDARLSLDRIREIMDKEDEAEQVEGLAISHELPKNQTLQLENVDFHYAGLNSEKVLNNINLTIPQGKITAIVGSSGSGKTTLLKLLMKFYDPNKGEIKLGATPLKQMANETWRNRCGVVRQEGYIFNDTIKNNIAVGVDQPDNEKLEKAIGIANINDVIDNLPFGLNTKIGNSGQGLSQGQKQRILIARSVYKDPDFIFFDEATNSLDANNEAKIMKNLNEFFKGRTVVVVAHRLSTVKNADQIIVMEKGKIIENGTHENLTQQKGAYYNLVKNQLELGD